MYLNCCSLYSTALYCTVPSALNNVMTGCRLVLYSVQRNSSTPAMTKYQNPCTATSPKRPPFTAAESVAARMAAPSTVNMAPTYCG